MEIFKFFSKGKQSKSVAKERLKLVLIQDRNNLSPNIVSDLKLAITEAISIYVDINEEEMDIKLSRTKKEDNERPISELVINIPVSNLKEDLFK